MDIPLNENAWLDYPIEIVKIPVCELSYKDIAPASQWSIDELIPRKDIYVAILRKSGFDDVEVPLSSLQLRRRDGESTMVFAVVPDAMTYYDYANDRKDGELIIMAGSETEDGERHLSELDRAVLETVKYDVGVRSSSLTLSGYQTTENENARPIDLESITYQGLQADGKRRIRGKVNIFLRPGDTAIYNAGQDSFVVDQIYIYVEHDNSWMEAAGF